MSLCFSPDGRTDRGVFLAVAAAIRKLEAMAAGGTQFSIGKDESELLHTALESLLAMLAINDYIIAADTGRLRKITER